MKSEKKEQKRYLKRGFFCLVVCVGLIFSAGWSERIAQEEKRETYKVYCLGDSITYGSGLPEESRQEEAYPERLQQYLGAGYEVFNYGVSGRTLLDIPEKCYRNTGYIDLVKTQAPELVILMLGTNDSKDGYWNANAYKSQYLALVEELQEIEEEPLLYIMAPPRAFPGEDGEIIYGIDNEVIRGELHRIVEEVAAEAGAELIDLYAVTEAHPEYYVDGVHCNSAGYEALARAVCDAVKSRD